MDYYSIPNAPRVLKATEARLDAVYKAAQMGLKGDNLAFASGMTPQEFRSLAEFDHRVNIAAAAGLAYGELEVSGHLHAAAAAGDGKAAIDILKHAHGWTAKTAVDINIVERISILDALALAETRVIEGTLIETLPQPETVPDREPAHG